jgi:hypothetical protein
VRFILLWLLCSCAGAATLADIPEWLPRGILQTETGSVYDNSGVITYVRKDGPDYGPFQINKLSWKRLQNAKLVGASLGIDALEKDMRLADKTARLLMLDLYKKEANRDWFVVAAMWFHGPQGYKQNKTQARIRAQLIKNAGEAQLRK